jgi:hypothetical protein
VLLGWDALGQMGDADFKELVSLGPVDGRQHRRRLLQFGKIQSAPNFAFPHPSAGRKFPSATDEDWRAIVAEIDAWGGVSDLFLV